METENQALSIHRQTTNLSPVTEIGSVTTKNKRKNFNPRFTSATEEFDNDAPPNACTTELTVKIEKGKYSSEDEAMSGSEEDLSHHHNKLNEKDVAERLARFPSAEENLANAIESTRVKSLKDIQSPEQEAKYRDFAFKTMQELLNIYGLSLTFNDMVDAFKQQKLQMESTTQLEPPTPPRTPIISTASTSSNGDVSRTPVKLPNLHTSSTKLIKPTITLTPTSKLLADRHRGHGSVSDLSETEETIKNNNKQQQQKHFSDDLDDNFSDRESNKAYDFSRFNDDSNMSDAGNNSDQDSDMGLTIDSNNSFESRLSLPNTRKLMDNKSQTPLPFLSPLLHLAQLQNEAGEKQLSDYAKYLTKYTSYMDCNNEQCQSDNMREHYHCYNIQCYGRVLNKKEEIIRHLKWHKKRSESLNHGFLRFSSSDDCNSQYPNCQHNRKQTHYHCLYCDKCYISTSDVQMHSNYHRKDSVIYNEGFQRFRATETCNADYCSFYLQRTTHFHCRRDNCKYTFKNKADMEKHKTFHIKDEQLLKDGFKKFLKADECHFPNCRFSLVCNHIHCVRDNCNYVLHSSGQLLSHKRKHERIDHEEAYRRYKMSQKTNDGSSSSSPGLHANQGAISPEVTLTLPFNSNETPSPSNNAELVFQQLQMQQPSKNQNKFHARHSENQKESNIENLEEGIPKTVIQNSSFLEKLTTVEEVEQMIRTYFSDNCTKQRDEPLNLKNETGDPESNGLIECFMTSSDPHLHCLVPACEAVLPKSLNDISEHMKMHELTKNGENIGSGSNLQQITSIEGFFNRKRGRPPKNRVVEVYNNSQLPPQAIFTSFKLEKQEQMSSKVPHNNNNNNNTESTSSGFKFPSLSSALEKVRIFQPNEKCSDSGCIYDQCLHFHCTFSSRCHFVTNYSNSMENHLEEFHEQIKILENYEYFDNNYDCGKQPFECPNNKINRHFHCCKCQYSFLNPAEMETHICRLLIKSSTSTDQKSEIKLYKPHRTSEPPLNESHKSTSDGSDDLNKTEDEKVSVVRASGTFFPENSDPESLNASQNSSFGQESQGMCDRPFCKLKRKSHQHCDLCNQAFSDAAKLEIHMLKHQTTKLGNNLMDAERKRLEENSVELLPIPSTSKCDNLKPQDLSKASQNLDADVLGKGLPSPGSFSDSLALQNFHLAQLALQYPFYYQGMNPFLAAQAFPGLQFPPALDPQPSTSLKSGAAQTNTPHLIPSHFPFPNSLELTKIPPELLGPMAELQEFNKNSKRKSETEHAYELTNRIKMMKTAKTAAQAAGLKMFKDEPIPTGYLKFRFNEDCNFPNCGYRNHQSHFHCCRQDCFYSFCDKTRFVQHTARHERLDKLMGDDFKQYRANMRCGVDECAYNKNLGPNNKSSHFHCLKCDFICSDTNKVVAHRRQHSKMEYIREAGFRKIANNEKCNSKDYDSPNLECPYSLKQTHYHCLSCDGNVLSRAQLSAHRHRQTSSSS